MSSENFTTSSENSTMSSEDFTVPGGKWSSKSGSPTHTDKFVFKHKRGQPLKKRELTEKYRALGQENLELDINSGELLPDHSFNPRQQDTTISPLHAKIASRVGGTGVSAYTQRQGTLKKTNRSKTANEQLADQSI